MVGNLAMAVMRACSAQMRLGQHFLGVGLHDDRVYMHVKVRVPKSTCTSRYEYTEFTCTLRYVVNVQ